MKITKKLFDKLSDTNISKREYDSIISAIENRVFHIWPLLMEISCRKLEWYAFGNDIELAPGDGSTGGHFDPKEYNKWIEITGEYTRKYDGYYEYDDGFPTKFLWMEDGEWKKIVLTNIGESISRIKLDKETFKLKREEKKQKRSEMMEVIKNKLTKEELKYINFK